MLKLSEKQKEALKMLNQPYKHGGHHHPIDAYKSQTIHSLEKRGLVNFYHHHRFLHGAVKLTEKGKELSNSLKH